MFFDIDKQRKRVIMKMAIQGIHNKQHELFFKELWKEMRYQFSEENNTTTASFILEKLLSQLPLETINKNALLNCIDEAYKE